MLIGYVGSSDSNVTTTESRPVNTQQAENLQSSAPTFSTANAGSMANYYGTLASMQSSAKLIALLNPTYYQQAPPSPNDPPGTILPGDLGDHRAGGCFGKQRERGGFLPGFGMTLQAIEFQIGHESFRRDVALRRRRLSNRRRQGRSCCN